MGHRHEVGFGGQLVGGIAPVTVHEGAELAGLHEALEPILDIAEIAWRGQGPGGDGLGQVGGRLGVRPQGRDHVHPVQGMQMIEVHQVIMGLEGQLHEVADGVGVLGDLDTEGVLYRPHAGEGMGAGADATDALGEGPGITWVAALEDDLQPAPHGTGGHGVADDVVLVQVHLAAHVTFDTSHRVDHDPSAGVVQGEAVGGLDAHERSPCCCWA